MGKNGRSESVVAVRLACRAIAFSDGGSNGSVRW